MDSCSEIYPPPKNHDSSMTGGSKPFDQRSLRELAEILNLDKFLRGNWQNIRCKLAEAASGFDDETPRKPGSPSLLLNRARPLLLGIVYLGSAAEDLHLAQTWLSQRLPAHADRGLILAASVLMRIGSTSIDDDQTPREEQVWRRIRSDINLALANPESCPVNSASKPVSS